jgi:hypothetical protein
MLFIFFPKRQKAKLKGITNKPSLVICLHYFYILNINLLVQSSASLPTA